MCRKKKLLNKINKSNSVALHIRRGDYVSNKKASLKHGVCSIEYYKKAVNLINQNIKNPFYYIFSDDIEWAKANLNILNNLIFIENNKHDNSVTDLFLMSNCKHHIIANSTFSWWGAWMARTRNFEQLHQIVIAPKNWFLRGSPSSDLFPDQWMLL